MKIIKKTSEVKLEDVNFNTYGRQVNYPDLAYNVRLAIRWAEVNGLDAVALEALDAVYRDASPTYKKYSDKCKLKFPKALGVPVRVEEEAS